MDRKWLFSRVLPACSLALLGACAGDTGNDGTTTQNTGGEQADEYQPGRFPTQADLIDDIRCQIRGDCTASTGGSTGTGTGTGSSSDGSGGFLAGGGLFGGGGLLGGGGGDAFGGTSSSGIPPHGDPPLTGPSDSGGPYWVDSYDGSTGAIYYPRDAPGPFAGMALCGGFLNTGLEMLGWGEFYASWGIVTEISWTGIIDFPDQRSWALSSSIEELKAENANPISPIYQKMSGRYGTSGYSMGGGGTSVSAQADPSLKSSIGMAPWAPTGLGVQVPSLFICGDIDVVADCSHSEWAYGEMSESIPKAIAMISGGHLSWFGPDAGFGAGGGLGLAFAKVFLEGDQRWKPALLGMSEIYETNIY